MSAIARVPVAAKTVLGNVSQLKAQSKAPLVRALPASPPVFSILPRGPPWNPGPGECEAASLEGVPHNHLHSLPIDTPHSIAHRKPSARLRVG